MLNPNFVILAALFNLTGGISYVIDTLKGKVKPNRVSWFMWALAPLVAFFAELNKGVGIQSLMTFMVGFSPLLIFLASFVNKKSVWKIGKLDIICGVLSLLGLFLWFLTKEGNIAIIFAILADQLAAIPTIVKSYKFPETENAAPFTWGILSASITLLTITTWDIAHYGFPFSVLIVDLLIASLIKLKLGKLKF